MNRLLTKTVLTSNGTVLNSNGSKIDSITRVFEQFLPEMKRLNDELSLELIKFGPINLPETRLLLYIFYIRYYDEPIIFTPTERTELEKLQTKLESELKQELEQYKASKKQGIMSGGCGRSYYFAKTVVVLFIAAALGVEAYNFLAIRNINNLSEFEKGGICYEQYLLLKTTISMMSSKKILNWEFPDFSAIVEPIPFKWKGFLSTSWRPILQYGAQLAWGRKSCAAAVTSLVHESLLIKTAWSVYSFFALMIYSCLIEVDVPKTPRRRFFDGVIRACFLEGNPLVGPPLLLINGIETLVISIGRLRPAPGPAIQPLMAGPARQPALMAGPAIQPLMAGPARQPALMAGPPRQPALMAGPAPLALPVSQSGQGPRNRRYRKTKKNKNHKSKSLKRLKF
jgi:hypothetical protein